MTDDMRVALSLAILSQVALLTNLQSIAELFWLIAGYWLLRSVGGSPLFAKR